MSFISFLRKLLSTFSPLQLCGIFFLALVSLSGIVVGLSRLHEKLLITVPGFGGELHEGIIGSPRFINPVLAVSQSDADLSRLVYSGLMEKNADGQIVPLLAESYTESKDGLVYTFVLKKDIYFHDGVPLLADDVLFTIALAQDKELKSPRKIEWEGVRVEKIDDYTIRFTLKQPYRGFLENTTLGILPKHIWKDLQVSYVSMSDFNISPIGSGPYRIASIEKASGIPQKIHLEAFPQYVSGRPYISDVYIHIYNTSNEILAAIEKKEIDFSAAIPAEKAGLFKDSTRQTIHTAPLPRVYGVFFNTSKSGPLSQKEVRRALSVAVDRNAIISEHLFGFALPIVSPVPQRGTTTPPAAAEDSIKKAQDILTKSGWAYSTSTGVFEKTDPKTKKKTPLEITLTTTSSIEEFKNTATLLQETWGKVGVRVNIQLYEMGDLNQTIIKKRDYEALLYGTIVQSDTDLYAFWHSSQRSDPGLNLSMYANQKADTAISKLRTLKIGENPQPLYESFEKEINNDIPLISIYTPLYIYITNTKVQGVQLSHIQKGDDRYRNIERWYLKTERVWGWVRGVKTLEDIQRFIH